MFPILFKIGPIPIHTYGFFIALGFLVCLWVARRLATKSGINPDVMMDLGFWVLISGLIGGRLLFVITRWDYFMHDPVAIFKVWEGGLVFFGGLALAIPVGIYYLRKRRIDVWKSIDIGMPCVAIAHSFGRIGCLSAGCCYGKPTGTDFGIILYSELVDPDYRGIRLHPTQIYESVSLMVLFFGLLWVFKHKKFDGQVGLTYLMTYPIIRSIIEIYRGDLVRGFVIEGVLSTSQFISILFFIAALAIYIYRIQNLSSDGKSSPKRVG